MDTVPFSLEAWGSLDITTDSTGGAVDTENVVLEPGQRIAEFLGEAQFFKNYFEQNPGDFAGTLNVEVIEGSDAALIGLIQKKPGGDLIAVKATNNPFPGNSQQ